MRRITWLLVLAAAAVAVVAGAGCGDDEEEPAATTTTSQAADPAAGPTLDRWGAQADRICAQGDRATQRAAQRQFGEEPPSEAELMEFAETVLIPNLQSQHDAIEQLPRPEGEADRVDEMLGSLQEGIDSVSDDPLQLIQGTDSVPAITRATEIARDLGLTDCGSG